MVPAGASLTRVDLTGCGFFVEAAELAYTLAAMVTGIKAIVSVPHHCDAVLPGNEQGLL